MLCKNCSQPILPKARWEELGYDYCQDPFCIKAVGKKGLNVVVVNAGKNGTFVMLAENAKGVNFVDVNRRRIDSNH
jgi:hypothetical protein